MISNRFLVIWVQTAARVAAVCTVLTASCGAVPAVLAGPAAAITPPAADLSALPSDSPIAPLQTTEQREVCAKPASSGADFTSPTVAMRALDIPQAWQFSRGTGQKVAVIDSGVAAMPRLTVIPGGDYVSSGDGTSDCDGHGTEVAGIIAAHQSSSDGFAGVAPDAKIIAIRQTSESFSAKNSSGDKPPGAMSSGYGNLTTLGRAIMRAVGLGATVINISEAACARVGTAMNDGGTGAALRYAYEHNVVIVAAAGNVSADGPCTSQNPSYNAANPSDPWGAVSTVSSPAWYSKYLLVVGAVDANGSPASWSLRGPWVSVAAPGTGIASLNSTASGPDVVDGQQVEGKFQTLAGTSFAAPYVAGLAALIRSRFPNLTAGQVMDRIVRSAHGVSDRRDAAVGFGIIDPVAALTNTLTSASAASSVYAETQVAPPVDAAAPSNTPRYVALGAAAGAVVAGLVTWFAVAPRRRTKRLVEDVDY